MRVLLDYELGTVAVEFVPGTRSRLRRPVLGEWCDWQERHEANGRVLAALIGKADDAVDIDDATLGNGARALNYDILCRLLVSPTPKLGEDHPVWLMLSDRRLTAELLAFWRDYPVSPWLNAAEVDDGDTGEGESGRRLIRSALPGALGARAVLYKALGDRLSPHQVDGLELWQIAALLGRDSIDEVAGGPDGQLAGAPVFEDFDDGGRVVRRGNVETRTWRRKPDAPFLFAAQPTPVQTG